MNNILVRHPVGVTLLGRGEVRAEDLAEALGHAPALVAVDGGARVAVELGHLPAAVIGDMDSLPPAQRLALPEGAFHRIEEQDSTDFDKALRSVAAPVILGVGFLGRRADHQLANYNVLIRRHDRRCILIGEHDVIFAAPGERLVLRHLATDRAIFARGALQAALWGQDKGPGEYDMMDVLRLD